jgi:hypothetical protein
MIAHAIGIALGLATFALEWGQARQWQIAGNWF